MTIDYTQENTRKKTSQTKPIVGRETEQAKNNAGGYSFVLDKWGRLNRFLILGTEGGTYYVSQKDLTKQNVDNLIDCIKDDGLKVLQTVVDISTNNRAPKNDQAIFAMACLMANGSPEVRRATSQNLSKVCRIGTHLFMYAHYVNALRGWGRAVRKSVELWYNTKETDKLQYQLVKYQGRQIEGTDNKWTHKDVLRMAHVKPNSDIQNDLFGYAVKGFNPEVHNKYDILNAVNELKEIDATDVKASARLIETFNLPHETWPTQLKNVKEIWEASLPNMPLTATIRSLAKLTSIGVVDKFSENTKVIVDKLLDPEYIKRSRVHPMTILTAMLTYAQGRGFKGSLTWSPNQKIVDALNDAFYLSFGNVEKTGKNILLALDVSSSMNSLVAGSNILSCRTASAAMALITANVEDNYEFIGFTSGGSNYSAGATRGRFGFGTGVSELSISPKQRLDDVVGYLDSLDFGGTDCSLPMKYAIERKYDIDAFFVYTDNETYAGDIHPSQALKQYRNQSGRDAKLGVIGMATNEFSIADPKDKGMLDFVGFDTSTPQILSEFISGNI